VLSHISTIEIDEFAIKKHIEKQYKEDVGQAQLTRELLRKFSPLTCKCDVFATTWFLYVCLVNIHGSRPVVLSAYFIN
jgi:hypothetical protein